jgi:aspartate/methionine/tyrosine aminotransferase
VAEFADVRDVVVSQLNALAPLATVPAADGAFYVLLKVDTDQSPMRIAEQLIREHRVAVIPGPAFGMTDGCYFRVAYGALQKATVAEGIGRLIRGLRAILR